MLKKTTLAVLGLAASGFAVAGTMGPVCTPGNVTVPCEAKRWDLGVQALYLKSVYDADKAYRVTNTPVAGYGELKNDWDWGYRLEGSYHFNTGNDVTLTWMHFKGDHNQDGLIGIYPISGAFTSSSPYTVYNENQLDQVNLVMGQHVDVGLVKKMRFYGGLQYANIRTSATNYYSTISSLLIAGGVSAVNQFDTADFRGVGPVVGLDYSYDITNALSLTANGAGSILYGTSRFANGFVFAPSNLVAASKYGSKRAMVPSLEAKLGLNYAYSMAQGVLNLEGGYQAVNYFNAIQSTGINGYFGSAITDSDYGLYGPYFGVKYVGNA